MVRRVAVVAGQSQAGLVSLEGPGPRRQAAEQLAERLRRAGLGEGRDYAGSIICHSFLKEQPDLNWRNPEVQEAMLDVMRFWLDKGVDGFRVDALWHVIKDAQFRDNPLDPDYVEGEMSPYERFIAGVFGRAAGVARDRRR